MTSPKYAIPFFEKLFMILVISNTQAANSFLRLSKAEKLEGTSTEGIASIITNFYLIGILNLQ